MSSQPKGLRKCGPQDPVAWIDDTEVEVRRWMAELGARTWTMARISAALGCSENTLRAWRDGETSMPVKKWKALRALAAEFGAKQKVGT